MVDTPKRRAPKLDAAREMMREEIKPLREDVAKLPGTKGAQIWPLAILIVLLAAVGGYAAKVFYDRQETRAAELAETFKVFSARMVALESRANSFATSKEIAELDAKFEAKFDDQASKIEQMGTSIVDAVGRMKAEVKAEVKAGGSVVAGEISRASQAALKLEKGAATMVEMIEPIADKALQDINDARPR